MNKTSKFFLGFAALGMLSACSSDEPAGNIEPTVPGDGATMYLAVNLTDAVSRAADEDLSDKNEGDFAQGSEHDIKSANFFFFDANGVFLLQSEVWNDGKDGPDENVNVEYLGNNVIVLEGLTENNLPKYVVTVLNTPQAVINKMTAKVSTIDELRSLTLDSYLNGDGTFVMSTSSFRGGDTNFYDDNYYYANIIPDGYLQKEPINLGSTDLKNVLNIYVERLAAKYTLDKGSGSWNITLSVAGEGNENTSDRPSVGTTDLKVTVTGFGVTTTEKESYLSKNLDGFANNTAIGTWDFAKWNSADNHRSYWGKSLNYGNDVTADDFEHSLVATSISNNQFKPVYSLETTNAWSKLVRENTDPAEVDASAVTSFVITAEVTKTDGSKIDNLYKYNGVFFEGDQLIKYVLRSIQEDETLGLNYYKQVTSTSTTDDETGITDNNQTYRQIGPDDFKMVKMGNGGKMTWELSYEGDLYSYDATAEAGKKFTKLDDTAEKTVAQEINGKIESVVGTNYPVRYNEGKTVYTVPVQHLLGTDNKYTIANDGEFGVVRNHWYELTLSKISKIGQGVFDPSTGEDGDRVYPGSDPDPDTYGLAAAIKVLSWKVVKQSVDL